MLPQSLLISRAFVSATRLAHKTKINKEMCQSVIEAAEAVKDGAKEVQSVAADIKGAVKDEAGSAMKQVADKAIEKAVEGVEDEEKKGTWQILKDKTMAIKDGVISDK